MNQSRTKFWLFFSVVVWWGYRPDPLLLGWRRFQILPSDTEESLW